MSMRSSTDMTLNPSPRLRFLLLPSPGMQIHLPMHFLGNAINPDTGTIAEYKELSQCSEGPLWLASHAKEISRLT
jgi:hypothetical protein